MDSERWRRVNRLFHQTLELNPEERGGFLNQACADDQSLIEEVRDLLAAHERSGSFMDSPAGVAAARMLAEDQPSFADGQQLNSYRIISRIGAGGMGEVYLVEDARLDRKVAMKTLPSIFSHDARRLARFHTEARAAAALNHPNIATIYSIEEAADLHFITMEYVDGRPLSDPIFKRECDPGLFFNWFVPLADALAHAHDHGVIHRDIKPGNIMITSTGVPKLLDFGLARISRQSAEDDGSLDTVQSTGESGKMGTPAYMSPEQASGERAGSASDIFSLGVICYEFLSGEHPFATESKVDLVQAITTQSPIAPSHLSAEIPIGLDSLILRMLEKDARRRPGASEVKRRLAQLAEQHKQTEMRRANQRITKRHIVGREKEQALLRQGFENAASGRSLLLCITGEPGIGKTTVVEEFLKELNDEGHLFTIARGHCSERLASAEAYLPFRSAFTNLLHSDSSKLTIRLMQASAPNWYAQIAPPAIDERRIEKSSPLSRESIRQEMVALLQEFSRLKPVILFFDDLHWADASSIELLDYLTRNFDDLRLLILVAYRPSDLILAEHPFLKYKPEWQAHSVCREIPLAFLSVQEVADYLTLEFPVNRFPIDLPATIYARTEGNPLFMADLTSYLQDEQIIVEEDGHWVLTRSLNDITGELPLSVQGIIAHKIGQLSDADKRLLMAASVQGYDFDSTILAEALERDEVEIEERLARLEQVYHFILARNEAELPDQTLTVSYSFVHVLYQNSLYAHLHPTQRVKLSASVARALQHHYGARDGEIASTMAYLTEAGRNFTAAVNYYLCAAQNAIQVSALHEAKAFAHRGLNLLPRLPDPVERDRQELELQLAFGVAVSGGESWALPEAKRAFIRASELCQRTGEESRLFGVLCGVWAHHAFRAELADALDVAQELRTLAKKIQNRAVIATACYTLGFTYYFQADYRQAKEQFEQVISLNHPDDHEFYISIANINLGLFAPYFLAGSLFQLGYPDQGLRHAQEALALSVQSPYPVVIAYAFMGTADIHLYRREWRDHQQLREKYCVFVQENKVTVAHFYQVLVELSAALGYQGQAETAVAQIRQHLSVLLSNGIGAKVSEHLCLLADLTGRAGQPKEGLRIIDESLKFVNRTGERFWEAEIHRTKGELLLQTNDDQSPVITREAEACFLKAIEVARTQQARSWELRATTSLARLWKQTGRKEEARQRLAEIHGWFTEGVETADLQDAGALLAELSN